MINDSVDSLHRQSDIETYNDSSVEALKKWNSSQIGFIHLL